MCRKTNQVNNSAPSGLSHRRLLSFQRKIIPRAAWLLRGTSANRAALAWPALPRPYRPWCFDKGSRQAPLAANIALKPKRMDRLVRGRRVRV